MQKAKLTRIKYVKFHGGENGIRTHDRVTSIHAFQACALNRSATSPFYLSYNLLVILNKI